LYHFLTILYSHIPRQPLPPSPLSCPNGSLDNCVPGRLHQVSHSFPLLWSASDKCCRPWNSSGRLLPFLYGIQSSGPGPTRNHMSCCHPMSYKTEQGYLATPLHKTATFPIVSFFRFQATIIFPMFTCSTPSCSSISVHLFLKAPVVKSNINPMIDPRTRDSPSSSVAIISLQLSS
jgi:hypothetical protein